MRETLTIEACRVRKGPLASDPSYGLNGAFIVATKDGVILHIIASDGVDPYVGWEHVSVSYANKRTSRTPNWREMCFVKDLFWEPEETVIQFHPPKSEYVNYHSGTLHLWKPRDRFIPTPPSFLVGPK